MGREPSFAVHPSRTQIVAADPLQGSPVSVVLSDGNKVDGDVFSLAFLFWNDGAVPIRPEDILEPISLCFSGTERVLDVTVREVTRKVVSFSADRCPGDLGMRCICPRFRILEEKDGAVGEILYSGNRYSALEVTGSVEGVREVQTANQLVATQFWYNYAGDVLIGVVILVLLAASIKLWAFRVSLLFFGVSHGFLTLLWKTRLFSSSSFVGTSRHSYPSGGGMPAHLISFMITFLVTFGFVIFWFFVRPLLIPPDSGALLLESFPSGLRS